MNIIASVGSWDVNAIYIDALHLPGAAPGTDVYGDLILQFTECFKGGDLIAFGADSDLIVESPADLDADGFVGAGDLTIALSGWGTSVGDLDGSGTTTALDIAILLSLWGSH